MVKPFYVDTTGAWVPGYNQQNGAGSQMQAGARAELIQSPVTKALSTFGGRIAARTMQYMYRGNIRSVLNYVAIRPFAMMDAIKLALGESKGDKVVLNPAGGYSPVFYWLAQEFKDTQFIEMDIEKVIKEKKLALEPSGIPSNLSLKVFDLSEHNLHDVQTEPVDVLVTNGAYVSRSDFRDMLRYILNILKEDGAVVATFPNKSRIENYLENSTVFSRIVTQPKGAIADETELPFVFRDSGLSLRHTIKLSELAKKYAKPEPADIELIAIARPGDIQESDAAKDDELDILLEMSDIPASPSSESNVPPFRDVDASSFRRFPRRQRNRPSKDKK